MYPERFIHLLNFPKIPDEILAKVNRNLNDYQYKAESPDGIWKWTDDQNKEINEWCQANICSTCYYAFLMIFDDLPMHKDPETEIKFNYLIDTGGDDVYTEFFDEDQKELLQSEKIPANSWYLIKANKWHHVVGVQPGRPRFLITARVYSW